MGKRTLIRRFPAEPVLDGTKAHLTTNPIANSRARNGLELDHPYLNAMYNSICHLACWVQTRCFRYCLGDVVLKASEAKDHKIMHDSMIKCPRQVFSVAPGNNGNENRPWRFYQIKINVKLSRKTLMFTLDDTSPKTMATDLWFVLLLQTWSVCVRWKNYRNIDVVRSHLSKSVGENKNRNGTFFTSFFVWCAPLADNNTSSRGEPPDNSRLMRASQLAPAGTQSRSVAPTSSLQELALPPNNTHTHSSHPSGSGAVAKMHAASPPPSTHSLQWPKSVYLLECEVNS